VRRHEQVLPTGRLVELVSSGSVEV
jgi:hypothetical protein